MKSTPILGGEHIAGVRLTVQELPSGATVADRSSQASERVEEERSVRVGELGREVAARHEVLRLLNTIGEVGRRDSKHAHAVMEPLEGTGIVGGFDRSRGRRFVVGPQCDRKAITRIDTGGHSPLKSRHRHPHAASR